MGSILLPGLAYPYFNNMNFRQLGLALVIGVTCIGCGQNEMNSPRKEMPFERYGFERTAIDKKSFEFLMGNGEMGGRLHFNGLGFEKLWFADYWKNPKQRQFLPGILLTNDFDNNSLTFYKSRLDIDKALAIMDVKYETGEAYHAELLVSFANDQLISLSVHNQSEKEITFQVALPLDSFFINRIHEFTWTGTTAAKDDYNSISWAIRTSLPLHDQGGKTTITVLPGQSLEINYGIATQYDATDHLQLAVESAKAYSAFDSSFDAHVSAWKKIRKGIGSIILPDSDYAKWFYRSIYTNYATAGSKHFLAAETQFAYPEEDWDMHAFTYGHGVWAALSFIQMGDSVRAKHSLNWLNQPESLKKNLKILIPDTGQLNMTYRGKKIDDAYYLDEYPADAFAFGHEQTDFGLDIPYTDDAHWDLQFHLNGFASSVFHRYAKYYNDPLFEKEVVYPVVKGTGTFWKALLKSGEGSGYILPPMLSLSENIVKPSVLDAVLAAKWNMAMADQYESKFNKNSDHGFSQLAEQIYIPQNDSIYLEYLHDPQQREGGGYFGIRACAYLGFPLFEQIKDIDKIKARKTLDKAWKRNNNGKGMISFISNWFALTDAYLGNGDLSLAKSKNALVYEDESDTQLYEAFAYQGDSVRARFNPYFLTGYSSFSLVPIAMMLQSYNETLYFFPAMPNSWRNVEFYDLPAEGGYRVSGMYRTKEDFEVVISKNNQVIKRLKNTHSQKISALIEAQ